MIYSYVCGRGSGRDSGRGVLCGLSGRGVLCGLSWYGRSGMVGMVWCLGMGFCFCFCFCFCLYEVLWLSWGVWVSYVGTSGWVRQVGRWYVVSTPARRWSARRWSARRHVDGQHVDGQRVIEWLTGNPCMLLVLSK